MYIWFKHKASLIAAMREAVIVLALMVMMLQIVAAPAGAEQHSEVQSTPPVAQQGSVTSPPANNNDGGSTSGGGDNATTNQSSPPSNGAGLIADPLKDESKADVGIIADPVRALGDSSTDQSSPPSNGVGIIADPIGDPGDNSNAPKAGDAAIHCSPGVGCSKEDSGDQKAATASADAQGKSANDIGDLHGCPHDYTYNEALDMCGPAEPEDLIPEFFLSDDDLTFGEFVDELGEIPTTLLSDAGFGFEVIGNRIDAGLAMLGDYIGGDAGALVSGAGAIIGTSVEVGGALLDGLGQGVGAVADGVGEVIDSVGDAVDDAWDEVSSWF